MPTDRSRLLSLPRDALERYRDFHAAYATRLLEEERAPFRHPDGGAGELFVRFASIADSRRRAAEAALVLGDDDAQLRVEAAGRAYEAAGSPYGAFLAVVAGAERSDLLTTAAYVLSDQGERSRDRTDVPDEIGPYDRDALASPVQQMYVAAALAATPHEAAAGMALELAERASRRAAVPCGPSGMPLVTYATAVLALADERELPPGLGLMALLVTADTAHRAAVRDATRRADWRVTMRGASAIDLDAFAFATLGLRVGITVVVAGLAGDVASDYFDGPSTRQ